jgi:hypothetical protein
MKQTTQPLTKDEHVLFAKQLYFFRDTLVDFASRHKKDSRAVWHIRRILRELGQLQGIMDGVDCAQFPDNPRPADPDFMDSPYISSTICDRAREEFAGAKE